MSVLDGCEQDVFDGEVAMHEVATGELQASGRGPVLARRIEQVEQVEQVGQGPPKSLHQEVAESVLLLMIALLTLGGYVGVVMTLVRVAH